MLYWPSMANFTGACLCAQLPAGAKGRSVQMDGDMGTVQTGGVSLEEGCWREGLFWGQRRRWSVVWGRCRRESLFREHCTEFSFVRCSNNPLDIDFGQ